MPVARAIIGLTVMVFFTSCTGSREGETAEESGDPASAEAAGAEAAGAETADVARRREDRFLQMVETRVLVVDGEKIPREERAATIRRLDLAYLESFTLLGADDPRARELMADEEGLEGALLLSLSSNGERGVEPDSVRTRSAPPQARDETPFPVRRITARLREAAWVPAGEDPEGDGRRAGSQDGRALFHWLDAETDTLWVRLAVHGEIDEEAPAVSLSFDLDDDAQTGAPWYGSNDAFRFDKMVSVGPVRREGDRFIGYNGVTDADGVRRRDWINERQGNVAFLLDPEGRSYVVGIAISDLAPSASRLHLIGSVGDRALWNDDLIDDGHATITLRP